MLVFIILILLSASSAWGAILNATTRATLITAITNAQPGDTVQIACGTYTNWGIVTIPITDDAAVANRITLRPVTPQCAIFSGQGALNLSVQSRAWTISGLKFQNQTGFGLVNSNGAAEGSLITLDGAQDVIVEDIVIQNVSGGGVIIPVMELAGPRPTTRITLRNIRINGYNQTGQGMAINVYGQANRGYITNVTIEDLLFQNRTVSAIVGNTKWARIGFDKTDYDSNIKVRRSTFLNDTPNAPFQDVLAIRASNVEVTDNLFQKSAGIEFRRGLNQVFSRNRIIDPNVTFTGAAVSMNDEGHVVTNNLCTTSLANKTCFRFGMGNAAAGADGVKDFVEFKNALFAHNTIDGFSDSSIDMTTVSTGPSDGATTVNPTGITMVNNAIKQATGTIVKGNSCNTQFTEIGNNGWSGAALAGCLTEGTNNTVSEPEWVSPAAGNYELANASPYINAGTNIECQLYTETDLPGKVRDTSPDIGAYEFSTGDDVIPPSATACDDLFGSAQDYLLCEQSDLTCEFNARMNGATCNDLCQSFNRVCVTSYGNELTSCTHIVEEACDLPRTDQICVCKLNAEAATPSTGGNRYVDTSCATPGDGTTETCGATGPWTSLQYAMETVDCFGMNEGDIINVKGNETPQNDGSWYDAEYDEVINLSPDSACAGVIVQNATGHHVTLDGTRDISGETWVELGTSNVFECQSANCGVESGFPFTAWYQIGSGLEQRLNLVQTNKSCTEDLAAGYMRYNPITKRVCAHLSDDSSPAAATYFRIPFHATALNLEDEDVDGITFRANPDKTGSFNITRYRDDLISMDASINQDIIIDGLNLSWASRDGIGSAEVLEVANYKFLNNDVSFVGRYGINWGYDLGEGDVIGNQVHDIGTYPVFEECWGIDEGCHDGYNFTNSAIRVHNCAIPDGERKGTIAHNAIYNMGGGSVGYSIGIEMWFCTYGNLVDSNLIYDSTGPGSDGDGGGFYGIVFNGIPAGLYHDNNVISNNRCENVDYCFAWDTDTETSQVGLRNDVVGNTCHNPYESCWVQENGTTVGGSLHFRNNLAVIDNGYAKLANIPSDSKWDVSFTNNGFECNHADCSGLDIATIQGVNYERAGDCTPTVDCIEDLGDANTYNSFALECGTMLLQEGSNAVNTGVNLDALPLDYLGNSRPFGAFSDIGAHELQTESVPLNLVQYGYRFYNTFRPDGVDPLADENVTPDIYNGGIYTLRFSVAGDDVNTAQYIANLTPYYQHCDPTCGEWLPITDGCTGTAVCFVDNPFREHEEAIANDLALEGRTYSGESRFIDDPARAAPIVFRSTDQIELEYSLRMGSLVDIGDTVSIRIQYSNGDEISNYLNMPTVTATAGKLLIIMGY